jgi:NAD+ synthase
MGRENAREIQHFIWQVTQTNPITDEVPDSKKSMTFSSEVLKFDIEEEIRKLSDSIREIVRGTFRRKGAAIAVSGGIDSSTCAALCTRALGKENVLAVFLPERDSSADALRLGQMLARRYDMPAVTETIEPILAAAGCYQRQLEAIRMVFPEYGDGWKNKIVLPSILTSDRLNVSHLTVQMPSGATRSERLPLAAYLQLVAATNFKQRTRAMMAYYHADRLNYAVCGTPNRLEYDQGFFVKGGDGLADFKPIAHLYKTQVYALARALDVPDEICRRHPTTDTFSLPQTQEEFYFALPYEQMDLCLYAHNHNVPAEEVAPVVGLTPEQVTRVFKDIEAKRRATLSLHLTSVVAESVPEIARLKPGVAG